MRFKAQVMSQEDINRTLVRLAHQILEKHPNTNDLCLIGIKTRGVPLANRLANNIKTIENIDIPVGSLDITLYRDDLTKINADPIYSNSEVNFSIENKIVVLVDDVIFTGRTARSGLDAIMDLGRPSKIELCVLIDRGHSELPIKANYVGKNIPTSLSEAIAVNLEEVDGINNVVINDLEGENL